MTARSTAALLAGIAAVTLSATPSSASEPAPLPQQRMAVGAAQVRDAAEKLGEGYEQAKALLTEDTSVAGRAAVRKVQDDIAGSRLPVHLPAGTQIAGSQAKVLVTDSGERLVVVPYVGSVVKPSGLTVSFDKAGSVTQSLEAIYQQKSSETGTVAVWVDGDLKKNLFFDARGIAAPSAAPTPATSDSALAARNFWDEFTYCLTNIMAVPNWLLGALGAVCGVACATAVLCLPCAAGVLVGFYSEASYCVGWAWARSG